MMQLVSYSELLCYLPTLTSLKQEPFIKYRHILHEANEKIIVANEKIII